MGIHKNFSLALSLRSGVRIINWGGLTWGLRYVTSFITLPDHNIYPVVLYLFINIYINPFATDFLGLVICNYFCGTFHCIYPYNCFINNDITTYYIPN